MIFFPNFIVAHQGLSAHVNISPNGTGKTKTTRQGLLSSRNIPETKISSLMQNEKY